MPPTLCWNPPWIFLGSISKALNNVCNLLPASRKHHQNIFLKIINPVVFSTSFDGTWSLQFQSSVVICTHRNIIQPLLVLVLSPFPAPLFSRASTLFLHLHNCHFQLSHSHSLTASILSSRVNKYHRHRSEIIWCQTTALCLSPKNTNNRTPASSSHIRMCMWGLRGR